MSKPFSLSVVVLCTASWLPEISCHHQCSNRPIQPRHDYNNKKLYKQNVHKIEIHLNLCDELMELCLECNELTKVSFEMLGCLSLPACTSLNHNSVTLIGNNSFLGFPELKELHVSYNKLESLRTGMFVGLRKLEKLDLDSNSITDIAESSFLGLIKLRTLCMIGNKLTVLTEGMFAGLENLLSCSWISKQH